MKVLVSSSEEEDNVDQEWKKKKKCYIKQLEGDLKKREDDHKKTRKMLSDVWKKFKKIQQEKKINDEENEDKLRKQKEELGTLESLISMEFF